MLLEVPHPSELLPGTLLGRRKRFFADVRLEDGREVVAHCVNTGKMEGLLDPGARVFVSEVPPESPRRLRFTWEIVAKDGLLVGANTLMANRLVRRLLEARRLPGFSRYSELRAEHAYGAGSRVDFWLRSGRREHFVEVKNCHLVYPDRAGYFPDAVSERATRHLRELEHAARRGASATVLFTVQRGDVARVRPSDLHDPEFARTAREVARHGVRFRALAIRPTLEGYQILREIPVDLEPYPLARVERFRSACVSRAGR